MDSNSNFAQNLVNTTFTESGNLICSNMVPARQKMHHICFIHFPVFLNTSPPHPTPPRPTPPHPSALGSYIKSVVARTLLPPPHPTPSQLQKTHFYSYGNRAVGINMMMAPVKPRLVVKVFKKEQGPRAYARSAGNKPVFFLFCFLWSRKFLRGWPNIHLDIWKFQYELLECFGQVFFGTNLSSFDVYIHPQWHIYQKLVINPSANCQLFFFGFAVYQITISRSIPSTGLSNPIYLVLSNMILSKFEI